MKIALLTEFPELYSSRRLIEAARKRGHDIDIVRTLQVVINIESNQPSLFFEGKKLDGFDAVIPRIGQSITFYGVAVLRQFEMMGVVALNTALAIRRSRDKLHALQLLGSNGIALPATAFAHDLNRSADIIGMAGGAPVVIKQLQGTEGIGVVLGETKNSAKSVIEAFRGADVDILVQEFIAESSGTDIRAIVVGAEVIAAMQRKGANGDFRSNLHRGGTASSVEITTQERETAIRSAQVMGLNVCGVDMLRSDRGPLVLEVNSSPGLEGIEDASGVDVADAIIEFLEAKK
ncbi:MAG: 30S ribosomal protein S6--L-glutamate ligase [Alphaproteobacteria bacterium]